MSFYSAATPQYKVPVQPVLALFPNAECQMKELFNEF